MPMKWVRDTNPYVHNYFGRLRIGPNATPVQIGAQSKKLLQKIVSGQKVILVGQELDEHAVSEAAKKLYEPASLGEELLLVHPQKTQKDRVWKKLAEQVQRLAVFPVPECPPPLVHPLAVFWFVPAPGVEAVELPPWEAFGFVEPGDEADIALDVVFDQ
jgi:hypothetical protein